MQSYLHCKYIPRLYWVQSYLGHFSQGVSYVYLHYPVKIYISFDILEISVITLEIKLIFSWESM